MGYTDPRTTGRKVIQKYVYEDCWSMFLSSNTYSGTGLHPDYTTHSGYTPPQQDIGWEGQPYELSVYGSIRDYWDDVSYGNLQIEAASTHSGGSDMYHTGIVNSIMSANGKHFVRWIKLDSPKSFYLSFHPYCDGPLVGDVYDNLVVLHGLDISNSEHIDCDVSAFDGKIGVVPAQRLTRSRGGRSVDRLK